jgi:sugar transferase (PEP-CTERM system associated)
MRLFKVYFPTSVVALLVSEAILLFGCYLAAAFWLAEIPSLFLFEDRGLTRIAVVSGSALTGLYFNDLYSQFRIRSRVQLAQKTCLILGVCFLLQSFLNYLKLSDWAMPKWMMIYGSAMVLLLQPAWRIFFDRFVLHGLGHQNVLFVGTSPLARIVAQKILEAPQFGMSILGWVDDEAPEKGLPGGDRLGPISQLREIADRWKPHRIIVGMTERRGRLPVQDLLDLRFSGVHIEDAQTTYELVFTRVNVKELRPSQLIFMTDLGPNQKSIFWQNLYSFAIALVAFILTLPVAILVGVLVKLTSRGPALYSQERVGKDGATFRLRKFRSMYQDAEARSGAVWAAENDPRVTPLGRWLRKLRLDELPQLINVLRGEMVIVGPRPERPEFVRVLANQIPYYLQRTAVKPGITGWAQINYGYSATLEDTLVKLEYDLYYIKNLSIWLDTYIMFQTFKVMLLSRGAQ